VGDDDEDAELDDTTFDGEDDFYADVMDRRVSAPTVVAGEDRQYP